MRGIDKKIFILFLLTFVIIFSNVVSADELFYVSAPTNNSFANVGRHSTSTYDMLWAEQTFYINDSFYVTNLETFIGNDSTGSYDQGINFSIFEVEIDGTKGEYLGEAVFPNEASLTANSFNDVNFNNPIYLEAGKYYWMVINGTIDTNNPNYWEVGQNTADWGQKGKFRYGDKSAPGSWFTDRTIFFRLNGTNENVNQTQRPVTGDFYTYEAAPTTTYLNIGINTRTLTTADNWGASMYEFSEFENKTITSVTVSTYNYFLRAPIAGVYWSARLCNSSTDESNPTWNNFQTYLTECETTPTYTVETNTLVAGNFITVNVTDFVQKRQAGGGTNFTVIWNFTVDSSSTEREVNSYSSRYTTNLTKLPYMEISFEIIIPPTPPPELEVGNITFNQQTFSSADDIELNCSSIHRVPGNVTFEYKLERNFIEIVNVNSSRVYLPNISVNILNISAVNTSSLDTFTFSCRAYGSVSDWLNTSFNITNAQSNITDINILGSIRGEGTLRPDENLLGYCSGYDNDTNDNVLFDYKWFLNGSLYSINERLTYNDSASHVSATLYGIGVEVKDDRLYVVDTATGDSVFVYDLDLNYIKTIVVNTSFAPTVPYSNIEYDVENDRWFLSYWINSGEITVFDNTWNETDSWPHAVGECDLSHPGGPTGVSGLAYKDGYLFATHPGTGVITKYSINGTCLGIVVNASEEYGLTGFYGLDYYDGFFYTIQSVSYNNRLYKFTEGFVLTDDVFNLTEQRKTRYDYGLDINNGILYSGSITDNDTITKFNFPNQTLNLGNNVTDYNVDTVLASEINGGDNWTLSCRASEGFEWSDWYNSSVKTISIAPVMQHVNITPSPTAYSYENLSGYCRASDVDGDNVTYNYDWYKDGIKQNMTNINYINEVVNISNSSYMVSPIGITYNGTHFAAVDYSNKYITSYNFDNQMIDENIYSVVYDLWPSATQFPRGIGWNGSHFIVLDTHLNTLYAITPDGVKSTYNVGFGEQDFYAYDGFYYILRSGVAAVYKFNTDFTSTGISYGIETVAYGIAQGGDYWWVAGNDNYVYKHYLNWTYTNERFYVGDVLTLLYDIEIVQDKIYLLDGTKRSIFSYSTNFTGYVEENIDINVDNLSSDLTSRGETWLLNCRAYDGVLYSDWINGTTSIINAPPINTNASILPVNASSDDTLSGVCDFIDNEGDAYTEQWTWYKNGVNYSYGTGSVGLILPSETARYDIWVLSCRANDSYDVSAWTNSSSVNLTNAISIIENVRIGPLTPIITDNLTGYCNITDNDSTDRFRVQYEWYQNGVLYKTGEHLNTTIKTAQEDPNGAYFPNLWSGNPDPVTYDGNYATGMNHDGNGDDEYYFNYTRSRNATGALWSILYDTTTYYFNISFNCMLGDTVNIFGKTYIGPNRDEIFCWDFVDNSWLYLGEYSFSLLALVKEENITWYYGSLQQEFELDTILWNETNPYDNWTFACRAYDGDNLTAWFNTSVLLGTTPPSTNTSRIVSLTNYTDATLEGWCNVTDIDTLDNITYDYTWYENGINFTYGTYPTNITQGIETNIHNITSGNTTKGDEWIFSCRGFDGTYYSNWTNSSSIIIINNVPTINSVGTVPTYPINQSDLNCTFNVTDIDIDSLNVSITWFKSIDKGATWNNVPGYDYTWVGVTHNLLYTTASGTGSVPSAGLTNYDLWKCQIDMTDGANNTLQNTTLAVVYPLENLTILSPTNNTILNKPINATFTVIDYHNLTSCNLTVNGTVTTNSSVENGTVTTIEYIPPSNAYYDWNVSCESASGSPSIISGNYIYAYDLQAPTYEGYYNTSVPSLYPQIGDPVNLSVDVIENLVDIEYCQYWINDNSTWWLYQEDYIGDSSGNYTYQTSFTIRNISVANNSNINWRVWCNDSAQNSAYSDTQNISVLDVNLPLILPGAGNIFLNNRTIITSNLYNMSYNFTYFDYNLFQSEVNVTCDNNGSIYYDAVFDWNVSIGNMTGVVNLTNLPPQKCTIFTASSDDHTKNKIPKYKETNIEDGFEFDTEHNINLKIKVKDETNKGNGNGKDKDKEKDKDNKYKIKTKQTNKKEDRYTFDFEFEEATDTRTFIVESDKKLYPQPSTLYPGHFVAWNEQTHSGNWIDFADNASNIQSVVYNKISDYMYEVTIVTSEVVDKYNFNSIGGTNIENASWEFYIGGYVNISTLNIYDNGTYMTDWNITIQTINSFPGLNGSWNVSTTSERVENLSNGTYWFNYTHANYFPQNYIVTISEINQSEIYATYQSVVNILTQNIKTGETLTGLNVTINNTANNLTTSVYTGNETTATFYVNASNYNAFINVDEYVPFNATFSVTYQENLTLMYNISFYVNFVFIDERTLDPFDITVPTTIKFLLFCEDGTFTTEVNDSTPTLPVFCNYEKFRFVLEYNGSVVIEPVSYYRDFVFPSESFNESFNLSIYLINIVDTPYIYNNFKIDDLLSEYDNPILYVKKVIDDQTEQITANYPDVENKIPAYLIQNHEYILVLESDNKPTQILGDYAANAGGDKFLRLYTVNLDTEQTGFINGVYYWIGKKNISGDLFAYAHYSDETNLTTSVRFTVFLDQYNGTVLYQTTVPGDSELEFFYNISDYVNETLYAELYYYHPLGSWHTGVGLLLQEISNLPAFLDHISENFMDWFITLILGVIAIMATIRTANKAALAVIGMGALFVFFGWYSLSWSVLALAAIIALISVLKAGDQKAL